MTVHDVARLLPDPTRLRELCRALAVLDVVLDPDSQDRYHDFDTAWGDDEAAIVRDGSGNEYAVVFTAAGVYIRGFDHESPMSPYATDDGEPWPGVLDTVPDAFHAQVAEPAFTDEDGTPTATVCLWREPADDTWQHGNIAFPDTAHGDPDGANWLFRLLTGGTPETTRDWATDYFEQPVDLEAVRHLFTAHPLTAAIVTALNPATTLPKIADKIARIGYPTDPPT